VKEGVRFIALDDEVFWGKSPILEANPKIPSTLSSEWLGNPKSATKFGLSSSEYITKQKRNGDCIKMERVP
jgi:hypothetical protein